MSALIAPTMQQLLAMQHEDGDRDFAMDPGERCRFCGCTTDAPCAIPLREDERGDFHLVARGSAETTMIMPCAWFLPRICNAPECIEKLLLEMRGRVVVFDAYGCARTG